MKIYFVQTSAYNGVMFVEDGMAKFVDAAPTGKLEGVDLYAKMEDGLLDVLQIVEELRRHFEAEGVADFSDIYGDELSAGEVLNSPDCECTLVGEYE